jgi:DNA adenine methylase
MQVRKPTEESSEHRFPDTKYMGSKRALLPFILRRIESLGFSRALDPFSGSGCVAYALKNTGAEVHTNDFLRFAYHTAKATVENNGTILGPKDLAFLLEKNKNARTFVRDTFLNLYFEDEDNEFLDNLWANLQQLPSAMKRSLALAAACRAAMKKRPRGIFTFTGKKGWDGRQDLKLSMREQFLDAVELFNKAVFSNRKRNKAMCGDVFQIDPGGYDLVYIDTPYVSPYSDCDYTRRYHFVEGFCTYWQGVEILENTTTKKIKSYKTHFSAKNGVITAFDKLFEQFRKAKLVVSYSSNGIPSKNEMVTLLKQYKKSVNVYQVEHRYHHGNHNHKVGDNNNAVKEYLFIAV